MLLCVFGSKLLTCFEASNRLVPEMDTPNRMAMKNTMILPTNRKQAKMVMKLPERWIMVGPLGRVLAVVY